MDINKIVEIAQKYKSQEINEETKECFDIYEQLKSSPESASELIPMFNEVVDAAFKTHLMILEILSYRIEFFWQDFEEDTQMFVLQFFFDGISNELMTKFIDPLQQKINNNIPNIAIKVIHYISRCQALLGSYTYPNPFDELWNYVYNFHDIHFALFIHYFYTITSNPSFVNLGNIQQIRSNMNGEVDNMICDKITDIIQKQEEFIYGAQALASYIKCGARYTEWTEIPEYFQYIINQINLSDVIEIICNMTVRLNYECSEFISNIPISDIFENAKSIVDNFSKNNNSNIEIVRKTATLLNAYIVTLDDSIDNVSDMFPYLIFFVSIVDNNTTYRIIPSLTYFMQQTNNVDMIERIVRRLESYFASKSDIVMENDRFVQTLCNVMSKTDLRVVGEFLGNCLDNQDFNTKSSVTAILASLSYLTDIPLDIKLGIYGRISTFYDQDYNPENDIQHFFYSYYLIFYLSKLYIPTSKEVSQMAPAQQAEEINENCQQAIQQIYSNLVENILPQGNVIFTLDFEYENQFLKPVRHIISKLKKFDVTFNEEIVSNIIDMILELPSLPEEGAKIIGTLITNESIGVLLPQLLQSFSENLEQERNDQLVDFSLMLLSNIKYADIDQSISEGIYSNLEFMHSIISNGSQYDRLIGLLFNAYATVAKFNPEIVQIFGHLIDQETGFVNQNNRYTICCSFHLMDAIIKSDHEINPELVQYFLETLPSLFYNSILMAPPNAESDRFMKEASTYYTQFWKTYMDKNKGDSDSLSTLFQNLVEMFCPQMDAGYKNSHFMIAMIDALIHLMSCGCPAPAMCNYFLFHSMSFLLTPGFNPSYPQHKLLMEISIRFHTLLIHDAPNEFKANFIEFLNIIGKSERTAAFFEGYFVTLNDTKNENIEELFYNPDIYMFYNSMISDRDSNTWEPQQQSATSSQV